MSKISENKVVIFGNNSFSKLLRIYLEEVGITVAAFTVDGEYVNGDCFDKLPLIPYEKLKLSYYAMMPIVIGVGYKKMNTVKQTIFQRLKNDGYKIIGFIHPTAKIAKTAIIGEGNIILENVVVQPFVKIENANLIWANVTISHDDEIGSFNTLAPASTVCGFVEIGNNCFIGSNSTIANNIHLADFTLVGAGAYVDDDTDKYGVYVPEKAVKLNKYSLDLI